jgi:hypothetical protein
VGQRRVIHDKIKRLKYKLLVFEWCRAPVSLVFRSDMGVNLKQPMMVRRIFFVLALVNPNLFWNGCQLECSRRCS